METKKTKTKVVVSMLALGGLMLLFLPAYAGNLEPSEPPGPTMKTLDEVEPRIPISSVPYIISASGSYYLAGDLQLSDPNAKAITVEANDVTIDLMGYSLVGPGPDSGRTYGIYMKWCSNVEIRNGTVREFRLAGIEEMDTAAGRGHRVINVRVASCGRDGIYLRGKNHLVKDCTIIGNGTEGMYVGSGSTVIDNGCYLNSSDGIGAVSGCTVIGNTCYENGGRGINVGSACSITGNTCYNNGSHGIYATDSTVSGNTCCNNGEAGIYAFDGCMVTGNIASHNNESNAEWWAGIRLNDDCLVKGNTATGNKQNNICVGGDDNVIEENLVVDSTGNGINFWDTGNFYANNRASGNNTNYANTSGNKDGGGNVSF